MSSLDRQVSRARSRLTFDVLCRRSCLGLLVAAGLWGLTIIVVRLFALDVPLWQGGWIAALLALLVGVVGMAMARPTAVQAAVALDTAAGLKERLSTALVMRQQNDAFVRAAVSDAEQAAAHVHVPSHIRYRSPELLPWSTAAVVAALILAWFMPTIDLLADEPEDAQQVPRAEVESEHQIIKVELEKKLSKIRELAQDNPELRDLVEDIEPLDMPDQPTVTPDDVRRDAAQKIDNIRDKLKEKLETAEDDGLKNTKRMFQQLNEPGNKPANDKLAQSLAGGDFAGRQAGAR